MRRGRATTTGDRRGHRRRIGALLLVMTVAAGCSSDGSDGAASSTTAQPEATSTTAAPTARGSEGCGTEPAVAGPAKERPFDVEQTFEGADGPRSYRLGIPDGYDPDQPHPLVVNLHGSGSDAVQQSTYADLPAKAGARGYVTVAPDAGDGAWDFGPTGPDDDFIDALVTEVETNYCIDLDRVHVMGMSLGSWKATLVACGHADRYASLVMVTENVRPGDCPPLPVVAFHGTADPIVPYGEGGDPSVTVTGPNAGLAGVESNIASWAEGAGCGDQPDKERVGDDVERWTFPDCDEGLDVVFYRVEGGGHTWPGADITIGPTTATIDATDLALDFFDAHPRR